MKNSRKNLYTLVILLITSTIITSVDSCTGPQKNPKNIIVLIGDGMGVAHVYAAMSVSAQPLNMEQFPYSGFSITYSANNYVTDSGAGGTAIACGIKANNYSIGMTPDSVAVPSIIEMAHMNGLATGVVSTSAITDATPASFVAHNMDRFNSEAIAEEFLKGSLDIFLGGGEDYFRKRKDERDLTTDLQKQGFDVVYTYDELKASNSNKIAGLFAKQHLPPMQEGRDDALSTMTTKAIETLSKDKDGFFLMVEGAQIDFVSHANDTIYTVLETIDFDNAVGAALEFAKADKRTLVIVTADHETGGLVIPGGDLMDKTISLKFSIPDHSAVMVPIFAYGPGAEQFSGINQNTFFYDRFMQLLEIKK
jgi:alkaline phosphatase